MMEQVQTGNAEEDEIAALEMRITAMVETINAAFQNIHAGQARQIEEYNRRYNAHLSIFEVGNLVLKYRAIRDTRAGGRLEAPWIGPYEIVEVGGNGIYKIKKCSTGRILQRFVNGSHL